MTAAAEGARRSPVSPKLYIIVGLILAAIPLGGYLVIRWRGAERKTAEAKKRAAKRKADEARKQAVEDCFRKPVRSVGHATTGRKNIVSSVAISPDGKQALAGYEDGTVTLWDLASGKELKKLSGHKDAVRSVAFSPDGKFAIAAGDGGLLLYDLARKREMEFPRKLIAFAAFMPDGKHVLVAGDWGVSIYDFAKGKKTAELLRQPTLFAAFSPDGKRVLGAIQRTGMNFAYIWDPEGGQVKSIMPRLDEYPYGVKSVAFSPDGKLALRALVKMDGYSWKDSENVWVGLWSLESGAIVRPLAGFTGWVYSVAFTPDGKRAIAGGWDPVQRDDIKAFTAAMRIWDVETGRLIREFSLPQTVESSASEVRCLAVSRDGRRMLSGSTWWDAKRMPHSELLLWRLPDELGYRLLGTEEGGKEE